MIRKTLTTLLLIAACALSQAQTWQSETIMGESRQNSIDLSQTRLHPDASLALDGRWRMPARTSLQPVSSRWIDRISNMPSELISFYNTYGQMVYDVLSGSSNALSDPTLGLYDEYNGNYSALIAEFQGTLDFSYPEGSTVEVIRDRCYDVVAPVCANQWNGIDNFMIYLCMCLSFDYPEGFWLDSYYQWGNRWSYRFSYAPNGTKGTVTYTHKVMFGLKSNNFDHRRTEFQNTQVLAEAVTEYNGRVKALVDGCPTDGRRYNQIVYLNDWLTSHNSYNSDYGYSDYVAKIAWSPLSALRGTVGSVGPVCEGYARAFKVLCDQLSIPCVLATGYAKGSSGDIGESHMWNEVQMDDGEWYAVDVTWDDPIDDQNRQVSGYENHNWLLLGSQDLVAPGFTFAQSHPLDFIWAVDPQKMALWDFEVKSLIADYHYDLAAGIDDIAAKSPTASQRLYTIDGRSLGTSRGDSSRLVVSKGRKMVLRRR